MSISEKKSSKKPQEQDRERVSSDIETTGAYLRKLREEKKLSLKDVCEATRISETNLNAIENQDFSALPADTFTRGLLTIHAKFLGADPAAIVARFMQDRDESMAQGRRSRTKQTRKILSPKRLAEPAHVSSITMAGILLLVIVLLFAGFCLYTSWNPFSFLMKENDSLQSVVTNVFPGNKAAESIPPLMESQVAPSPVASEKSVPVSESDADTQQQLAGPSEEYVLTVRFLKNVQIDVNRDDDKPLSATYAQGDEQTWKATASMQISFDQPDSAVILVNSQPIDFPAGENGLFTLRIPDDLPAPAAHD